MTTIDRYAGRSGVEAHMASTTNPRHRIMLQTVADHLGAEAEGSVEGLLSTLVDEPQYKFWINGADRGPKGRAAVTSYYEALVAARRAYLEYAIDRIMVDDDAVLTEGYITAYQPGRAAQAFGLNIDELDATYIVVYRSIIVWPFTADAKMIGEDGYHTFNPDSAVLVPAEDLPEDYVNRFEASEYAAAGIGPQ
jgi:hypothetical protein